MTSLTNNPTAVVGPLRAGQVIAYPTEAVFGLGCDPQCRDAVEAIADLKQRHLNQGFLIIGASFAHVAPYIDLVRVPANALDRAMSTWPGPFTWIFPASPDAPCWLTGARQGVAVRVTAHPWAAQVCTSFGGAIVSTSANPHGAAPARNANEAMVYFPTGLQMVLDAPVGDGAKPSSIRDVLSGTIVRQ